MIATLYDNSPYLTTDERGEPALDIRIRKVQPHLSAVRLDGQHANGSRDGVHTGGPFHWKDEVWKALDGRPYQNCLYHYPTMEMEALTALAGMAFVPKHWRHEYLNGRHWIVRPYGNIVGGPRLSWAWLSKEKLLELEQAIIAIGRAGWELHEDPGLAFNPTKEFRDLYLFDFSNATNSCGDVRKSEDHDRFLNWLPHIGRERLAWLRRTGQNIIVETWVKDAEAKHMVWKHAYASFYRPVGGWFRPGQEHIIVDKQYEGEWRPRSWILTQQPLPAEMIVNYQFDHAWSVIE